MMLTSRPYYGNDMEFYRRAEGGLRMPLSQSSPLVDQYDTASQLSRRTSPSSEADKPGLAPRKRVPVACERCRKRKIKCSGDQGGGTCTNCQQAGNENCQFLRVASIGTGDLVRHSMYARPTYGSRYSPYGYSSPYRCNYSSSQSAYSHVVPSSYPSMPNSMDCNGYGSGGQGLPWSRSNSYSSGYSPYTSETTSPYAAQGPNFILPNADPMASGSSYLVNTYPTKSQGSQVWSDESGPISQSQPASQVMTSGYALPSSDNLLSYQGSHNTTINNLRNDQMLPYQTLPSHQTSTLSSDRILPNPSTRNYTSYSHTGSTTDNLPMSALSHRSSLGWHTDTSSSSSHISSQTSCSSVGRSQDFGTDRPLPHRESQDLGYSYLGYTHSPQATLPSNSVGTLVNAAADGQSSHDSPSANANSSYSYTGNAAVTRSSQSSRNASSGQLSNGATYTRAAQPSLTRLESKADDCVAECQTSSNRASIASINNLQSY